VICDVVMVVGACGTGPGCMQDEDTVDGDSDSGHNCVCAAVVLLLGRPGY